MSSNKWNIAAGNCSLLKATGLYKYVLPFIGHQELKGYMKFDLYITLSNQCTGINWPGFSLWILLILRLPNKFTPQKSARTITE